MTSWSTQHCATLTIDFLWINCRSRKGFVFVFILQRTCQPLSLVGIHVYVGKMWADPGSTPGRSTAEVKPASSTQQSEAKSAYILWHHAFNILNSIRFNKKLASEAHIWWLDGRSMPLLDACIRGVMVSISRYCTGCSNPTVEHFH